jgi:hypothetical protein
MSKRRDYPRTLAEARAWLVKLESLEQPYDCEYGHFADSTVQGGPCSDEVHGEYLDSPEPTCEGCEAEGEVLDADNLCETCRQDRAADQAEARAESRD